MTGERQRSAVLMNASAASGQEASGSVRGTDEAVAVRMDAELEGFDVAAAISEGIGGNARARHALFTEASIAAAMKAEALGVGPYPVGFLARLVRAGGVMAALRLPGPLTGAEASTMARGWLEAALAAGTGLTQDQVFARWLEMVATLLAVRQRAAASRPEGVVPDA